MVNHDALADETDVGNFVRKKLKEAMAIHLNATFEAAEKSAIISGFGWDLVEQINSTPIKPGDSRGYKGKKKLFFVYYIYMFLVDIDKKFF
jgi:hypothetical protein